MGRPQTYPSSQKRALDNVAYVAKTATPKIPFGHRDIAQGRRPWDRPARHLNELGPAGYNFYRVTQLDEQRIWHADQLAESKRLPSLRDTEAVQLLRGSGRRLKGQWQTPVPPPSTTDTFFTVNKAAVYKFPRRPQSAPVPVSNHRPPSARRHLPAPSVQTSWGPTMLELMESPTVFSNATLRKAGVLPSPFAGPTPSTKPAGGLGKWGDADPNRAVGKEASLESHSYRLKIGWDGSDSSYRVRMGRVEGFKMPKLGFLGTQAS